MKIQSDQSMPIRDERKDGLRIQEPASQSTLRIPSTKDKVALSSFASEVSKASAVEASADTKRAEKVAELKRQVESGDYNPDLDQVADSLLKYIIKDE